MVMRSPEPRSGLGWACGYSCMKPTPGVIVRRRLLVLVYELGDGDSTPQEGPDSLCNGRDELWVIVER